MTERGGRSSPGIVAELGVCAGTDKGNARSDGSDPERDDDHRFGEGIGTLQPPRHRRRVPLDIVVARLRLHKSECGCPPCWSCFHQQVMDSLRGHHTAVAATLEAVLTEMGAHLCPRQHMLASQRALPRNGRIQASALPESR